MRIKLFISVLDNIEWGCLRPLRRIFPLVSSVNWVIHYQTSCRHQVQSIITPLYNILYSRNIMLLLYVIYLHFKQTFNQRRNYFLSACKVLGLGFHNLHLIPSFLCCCKLFVWGHVYELLPETQTIKQWEWLAQYDTKQFWVTGIKHFCDNLNKLPKTLTWIYILICTCICSLKTKWTFQHVNWTIKNLAQFPHVLLGTIFLFYQQISYWVLLIIGSMKILFITFFDKNCLINLSVAFSLVHKYNSYIQKYF